MFDKRIIPFYLNGGLMTNTPALRFDESTSGNYVASH